MYYVTILSALVLFVNTVKSQNAGQVVLYSGNYFQGVSQAFPFVAGSCKGGANGFTSPLNSSVGSLKTDHLITVHPMQDCKGNIKVKLGAGSYPDLPSFLRNQDPAFKTVMKSFYTDAFEQDTVDLFSRPGRPGQDPKLLLKLLIADIDHATPCFKFNDTMSRNIGGVDNHLNCLVFFTGKNCQRRVFKIEAQENLVSLEKYQPSQTYYGIRLCGNDNGPGKDTGKLKAAHVTVTLLNNDPFSKDNDKHIPRTTTNPFRL